MVATQRTFGKRDKGAKERKYIIGCGTSKKEWKIRSQDYTSNLAMPNENAKYTPRQLNFGR
jgi:hypothetical protein